MKTRNGFVSNSSTSSFIIKIKTPGKVCQHCLMKTPDVLDKIRNTTDCCDENRVDAVGYAEVLAYIEDNYYAESKEKAKRLVEKYKDDAIAIVTISYHSEELNELMNSPAVEVIQRDCE